MIQIFELRFIKIDISVVEEILDSKIWCKYDLVWVGFLKFL